MLESKSCKVSLNMLQNKPRGWHQ